MPNVRVNELTIAGTNENEKEGWRKVFKRKSERATERAGIYCTLVVHLNCRFASQRNSYKSTHASINTHTPNRKCDETNRMSIDLEAGRIYESNEKKAAKQTDELDKYRDMGV